jgi:hypothetical protein
MKVTGEGNCGKMREKMETKRDEVRKRGGEQREENRQSYPATKSYRPSTA